MVIRHVAPMSAAKVLGVMYAALGLILGGFITLAALAGMMASSSNGGGMLTGGLFGVAAIILLPLFYGCLGFIGTLIFAWLYNVIAGTIGGVEFDAA